MLANHLCNNILVGQGLQSPRYEQVSILDQSEIEFEENRLKANHEDGDPEQSRLSLSAEIESESLFLGISSEVFSKSKEG